MQRQRLGRELMKMSATPPHGICCFSKNDELGKLEAKIIGPEDTPYKDGTFTLEIIVPERYPFVPPSIKFLTRIYHPNIDDNGRICLDLLKMPPAGTWKPTIGLEGVLIAIRMLLQSPNPDDPLMVDIAHEYKYSKHEYLQKANLHTDKYARQ